MKKLIAGTRVPVAAKRLFTTIGFTRKRRINLKLRRS